MNQPTNLETLLGGLDLVAAKTDGSTEPIKVRQLPVKLYPAYLAALTNEPRMVELFCDRPAGWADTLTPPAFEAIVLEGERLNADFFGRWQLRRQRREALLPRQDPAEALALLETLQQKNPQLARTLIEAAGLTWPDLPPTSPPKPA